MDFDPDENITFENLTGLTTSLIGVWEAAAYITLLEVQDRNQAEQIARLELKSSEIEPYMVDGDPDETHIQQLARGVERWVQATVTQQMYARSSARFKLMAFGPKGSKCLFARRFGAVSTAFDDEPLPLPSPGDGPTSAAENAQMDFILKYARGVLSMSEHHNHWLLGAMRSVNSDLQTHNKRLAQECSRLLDVFLHEDRLTAMAVTSSAEESEKYRLRAELGKSTIEQLGKVTAHLAAGWSKLDPEMVDVLGVLQEDAELMKTLKSPKVRAFLKNADARAALKRVLLQFAAAYAEPAEGATAPDPQPPPANPTPSPTEKP